MRIVLKIIGLIMIAFGILWIAQGTGALMVGFMAGRSEFAVLGVATAVAGALLFFFSQNRKQR